MKTLSRRRGIRARSIARTARAPYAPGALRSGRTSLRVCPFTLESLELCPKRGAGPGTVCAYSLEQCPRPA